MGNSDWIDKADILKDELHRLNDRLHNAMIYINKTQQYVEKKKYDSNIMNSRVVGLEDDINSSACMLSIRGIKLYKSLDNKCSYKLSTGNIKIIKKV